MRKRTVLEVIALATMLAACGSDNTTTTSDVPDTEVVSTEVAVVTEKEEVETENTETETEEVIPETETEEQTEEVETEQAEQFTVTDMSATKYAKQSANVRKGPSKDYETVGSLGMNQQVTVTGQADTGWYRIEYNGDVAYVSNSLLVDNKVAVNTTTNDNNTNAVTTPGVTQTQPAEVPQTPQVDTGNTGYVDNSNANESATEVSVPPVDNSQQAAPPVDNSANNEQQTPPVDTTQINNPTNNTDQSQPTMSFNDKVWEPGGGEDVGVGGSWID